MPVLLNLPQPGHPGGIRFLTAAALRTLLRTHLFSLALWGAALAPHSTAMAAPGAAVTDGESSSLPNAPQAEPKEEAKTHNILGVEVGPAYPPIGGKWDTVINAGEQARPLTAGGKILYGLNEQLKPLSLIPLFASAGYGQVTNANPHAGVDAGGFGERLGYAGLRQSSNRILGDGLLPALFRQDPRFYRVTNGPLFYRGTHAAMQTFVRRNDDGDNRINYSGILGHALAEGLTVAYYPRTSAKARIAAESFGTSMAFDMGGKLAFEFGPDILRLIFVHNP